jgi:hypothetical protein
VTAAISDARWAIAQQCERDWWSARDRRAEAEQSAPWYAERLGITETDGLRILDLGGGPFPIGALLALPCASYTVVDPLATMPMAFTGGLVIDRVPVAAEDYVGAVVDEVWGYNVLQHVLDPAAVLETAKRHAERAVRWFDWVETGVYPVHPHSLSADWLRAQFADGWRITTDERGSVEVPHTQSYIALVAERL